MSEVVTMLDIAKPAVVDIEIREDGKVVWINIDGLCRLRACRIEHLQITDHRHKGESSE